MSPPRPRRPSGVGLGLRMAFGSELLSRRPDAVRWLEVHPENYVRRGGRFASLLESAGETWAFAAHGLSLSLGSVDPFDPAYLAALRAFLDDIDAPWYSDHLCFSGVGNAHSHDLLPIPRTPEMVEVAATRIRELQDALGRDIAVENVSAYAGSAQDSMSEIAFLLAVVERADAKLLLDVNNVWVNSINHGFDANAYVDAIPPERVVQLHVAGHTVRPDGLIIDTHAEPVCDGVFGLLRRVLQRTGHVPVLLERDGNYPPLEVLLAEVDALSAIYDETLGAP